MKNTDTRVQYTKTALKNALLKIIHKKPISKVTVKELCEEAGLNRTTFYLHYGEPNDVLKELEDDMISRCVPDFGKYASKNNDLNILSELFNATFEDRDLLMLLAGPNGAPQFTERIRKRMWKTVKDIWEKEFPDYDPADLEFVYNYVFTGSIQAQLQWIEGGKTMTSEQMARRLDRLGHYCHLAIKEF